MKTYNLTEEQFDSIQKALGRVQSLEETVRALQEQEKQLEAQFGRIPKRGVALPGRWAGANSDADDNEMKMGFAHWVRCVLTKKTYKDTPEFVTKALAEGSATTGGNLVPEIFIPELVRIIQLRALMRNLVRVFPMTTDTSNLPSLTTGMTVYWPSENQEITESDPAFGQVTLNAKTMAALTGASMELDEDSEIALASLLITLFGEAIADEEDRQILVGNTDPFVGLTHASSVNQVTMAGGKTSFADVDFNDILDLIDAVTSKAAIGSRFFMHRNILTILRKVRDLNHQYIWAPPAAPGEPGTIWGYPYTLSDQMPSMASDGVSTVFLGFGNPQYIFLGDRRTFTVAASDHIGFKTNTRFWKVTERIAVKVGIPAALARIRTAAA